MTTALVPGRFPAASRLEAVAPDTFEVRALPGIDFTGGIRARF